MQDQEAPCIPYIFDNKTLGINNGISGIDQLQIFEEFFPILTSDILH